MSSLREFIEAADHRICKQFRKKGQVFPMYHIIDGEGRQIVMPVPPVYSDDKTLAMTIVRMTFAEMAARRYVFITEAWIAEPKTAPESEQLKSYMQEHSLEHLPGRKEVLVYSAEDENEGALTAMREILRKGGRPTLGPLNVMPMDGMEGRMVGLLPRKGRLQ